MTQAHDDEDTYDVVIVGAGIAGGILAKELLAKGFSVLILEQGADQGHDWRTYRNYLDQYYLSLAKTPNSPYPDEATSPSPSVLDIMPVHGTSPQTDGYFVQRGPVAFGSNYLNTYGGTTLHWLGTSLRMLPADFAMASRFGKSVDWPFGYEELRPAYEKAEWEIGVAAEVSEQSMKARGLRPSDPGDSEIFHSPDYQFPMHGIPQSYTDRYFADRADGTEVSTVSGTVASHTDEVIAVKVSPTPQGRNSTPRLADEKGALPVVAGKQIETPYQPRGATGAFAFVGQRCEGNSSCIPICPIQAKYNAMKTLEDSKAQARVRATAQNKSQANSIGEKAARASIGKQQIDRIFRIKTQSVASEVELDENNQVSGIVYKHYDFPGVPTYTLRRARGRQYVLAGGALENTTLALASGLCRSNDALGRNLMDHPYMMAWGRAKDPVGPFRGPGSTSGIASFRDGHFRREKAAFRLEIGNWGWNFAAGSPQSDVSRMVRRDNLFGCELRQKLWHDVQRQIRIGVLVEQLPRESNRVTIDPAYRTAMGQFRPVISYDIADYSRAGLALAHKACQQIFQRMGVEDHTNYDPGAAGYLTWSGQGFTVFGSGHLAGTHRMGSEATRSTSVTDQYMRTWDHSNLWMVGCGSMPTIATSNPTLTMAALAFRAADAISEALT
jgi:choline dehydrogenase-like flavoprotein